MKLLYNNTPQVAFDIIYALILSEILTNKAELGQMNGYGAIYANDEAVHNFYIFCFKYVPYTLHEDVESDGNRLASGNFVCNAIYTSTRQNKSHFNVDLLKKSVAVSINTVTITNLDVNVWTNKMIFHMVIYYVPEPHPILQDKDLLNLQTLSMI